MKRLWIAAVFFSTLSGIAWVAAENITSPDPQPSVKPVMNMDPDVGSSRNIELNQTAIRSYAFQIESARKSLVRDNQKLTDDSTKLLDARSVKDERAINQNQSDIQKDQNAIEKDRALLKKNLMKKINADQLLVRRNDEKVEVAQKFLRRDSQKVAADNAKVDDARSRYEAEETQQRRADMEQDQKTVDADTIQLNQDRLDQAGSADQLVADRRHLTAAEQNLNENGDTPESLKYKNRDTDAK
jgi:hypothetical protein